jgi:hypothetical protein
MRILAAWFVLALGRRRRAERGGIDRLGRALGTAWIVGMVVGFIAGSMV